jgi:DNA-binding winged helix-turn-helix (wHTH) protein
MPHNQQTTFEGGPLADAKIVINGPSPELWQDADIHYTAGPDGSVGLDKSGLLCLARSVGDEGMVWIRPGVIEESPRLAPRAGLIDLGLELVPLSEAEAETPHLEFFNQRLVLDEGRNMLFFDGQLVEMQPQISLVLLTLMKRHDSVVSHQTLREEAWQGRDIARKTLTQYVSRCRALFGVAGKELILPFRDQGYMFRTEGLVAADSPKKA